MIPSPLSVVRSVRLDDRSLEAMLDRLDGACLDRAQRREGSRFRYRLRGCIVQVRTMQDTPPTNYLVPTRNLSAGGIGFLHGGFIHPGTPCRILLLSVFGTWVPVDGVIIRCRHLDGLIHEMGARFHTRLRVRDFCTEAAKYRVLLYAPDTQSAGPPGSLLHKRGVTVRRVETEEDLVQHAVESDWDAILIEVDHKAFDGCAVVRDLRTRTCNGLVLGVASDPDAHLSRCVEAGFDGVIIKLVTEASVNALLRHLRHEPLLSSRHNHRPTRPLIDSFASGMPQRLRTIEMARIRKDHHTLSTLLHELAEDAASHGFEPISTLASEACERLGGGASPDHLADCLAQVVDLGRAVFHAYRPVAASASKC